LPSRQSSRAQRKITLHRKHRADLQDSRLRDSCQVQHIRNSCNPTTMSAQYTPVGQGLDTSYPPQQRTLLHPQRHYIPVSSFHSSATPSQILAANTHSVRTATASASHGMALPDRRDRCGRQARKEGRYVVRHARTELQLSGRDVRLAGTVDGFRVLLGVLVQLFVPVISTFYPLTLGSFNLVVRELENRWCSRTQIMYSANMRDAR
jgi:hypothetical protein